MRGKKQRRVLLWVCLLHFQVFPQLSKGPSVHLLDSPTLSGDQNPCLEGTGRALCLQGYISLFRSDSVTEKEMGPQIFIPKGMQAGGSSGSQNNWFLHIREESDHPAADMCVRLIKTPGPTKLVCDKAGKHTCWAFIMKGHPRFGNSTPAGSVGMPEPNCQMPLLCPVPGRGSLPFQLTWCCQNQWYGTAFPAPPH